MRIEVLRNLGRDLPPLKEGAVADVDDDMGELLCKRGLAKLIAVPKPVVKAVPPEELKDGTVEKAEADLKAYTKKAKRETSD